MREQRQAFIDKSAGSRAPLPFDEKKLAAEIKAAMIAANLPPQIIYAYEEIGLMLFAEDLSHCPTDWRKE